MKAQGSLEYLIIAAAVLAVAAVVVISLSNVFSGVKADVSKCKAAAQQCYGERLSTTNPVCSGCDAACLDSQGKDVMSSTSGPGGAAFICKQGTPLRISTTPVPQELAPDASTLGLWHFNEGSGMTAADGSGNRKNGTLQSAAMWTTNGKFGSALTFNGLPNGNYVNLSNFNTTTITISAWIYPNAWATYRPVITEANSFGIERTTGGLAFWIYNGTGWANSKTAAEVPTNVWSHVAAVYNGSHAMMYLNGVQSGTPTAISKIANSTSIARLGWNDADASSERFFNGTMDEVAIYNRTLSAAEIWVDANA